MRRVVVTGVGLVSPLGVGASPTWASLLRGSSGVRPLPPPTEGKGEGLPARVAATLPHPTQPGGLDLPALFTESEVRSCSRATLFALLAAEEALSSAQLLMRPNGPEPGSEKSGSRPALGVDGERVGVAVGAGLPDLQDVVDTGALKYSRISPHFIPRLLLNMAAGQISIRYGLMGPNHCVSTACATGAHAIGDAFSFIRDGMADVMVCGGTEASISALTIAGFCRLRALSTKFNDHPSTASRPFDKDRDGFVMGEGAGILVLEELDHALKRGAPILGELLGYGLSGDGHHATAAREDGHGAFLAMSNCLKSAGVSPSEISYVNCHATSTPIGDRAEVTALRKLFKDPNLNGTPISSCKGSLGHLLGAAGAVESALTILAISQIEKGKKWVWPPSINIRELDPFFSGINIVRETTKNETTPLEGRIVALKNSFGFGGTNASLCFGSYIK